MIIACVKVGTKFGSEYVNRLAAAVARHSSRPHRFLCLTDDPRGVSCGCEHIGTRLPGWWSKLVLFKPHPALRGERVLFFDLDTVITESIDPLLDYAGDFAILRDFHSKPNHRPDAMGSAVMGISVGFGRGIWDKLIETGEENVMRGGFGHGDQGWIERTAPKADRWQDIFPGLIGSYKTDQLQSGPGGFSVVCFHGKPMPHEVDGWVKESWRD